MAKLSPAAQKILDALNMDELNGLEQVLVRACAVAVLQVAAIELSKTSIMTVSNNDWGHGWIEGNLDATSQLLTIAKELEGEHE